MVEIKPRPEDSSRNALFDDKDGSQFRLLYSKSKVYVNPTVYARDNIPGFVALVKRVSESHAFRISSNSAVLTGCH